MNILQRVEAACKVINHSKADQLAIHASMTEEVGEVATELLINKGFKPKAPGKDGVVGEAIDVILCAMDIIYTEIGSLDNEQVNQTVDAKLAKWVSKYGQ